MSRTLALAIVCAGQSHAQIQGESMPVEITDEREIITHKIWPQPVAHLPWKDLSGEARVDPWRLKLTVNGLRDVVEAAAQPGAAELPEEVMQAAKTIRFKPFVRNGQAVQARVPFDLSSQTEDYVGPPERAFPKDPVPQDTAIALRRSGCNPSCGNYRVEVTGDGAVTYRGDSLVLVKGEHRWRVAPEAVASLLELFRSADFFKLGGYYGYGSDSERTFVTRLRIGDQQKLVIDVHGDRDESRATPARSSVMKLESDIDRLSGARSWTSGDANSVAALRDARWNFRSAEGGQALGQLVRDCNVQLAREFIGQGAPVDSAGEGPAGGMGARLGDTSAVVRVAYCADVELARLMESKGAFTRPDNAKAFLQESVWSGYPEMVALALRHYRNGSMITADRYRNGNTITTEGTPLIVAAAGTGIHNGKAPGAAKFDSTEVVRMLLAAGADARAADKSGDTALHKARNATTAALLIKAGADPNVQNASGETPLFNRTVYDRLDPTRVDELRKVLLQAGADVTLRNRRGQTPLFVQFSVATVNAFIAAGADVNAVDSDGRTPLEIQVNEQAAQALLAAGARLPASRQRLEDLISRAKSLDWKDLPAVYESARRYFDWGFRQGP